MNSGGLNFETWDAGRLQVNRQFCEVLEANGLTTFAALFDLAGGEIVRAIGNRSTAHVQLVTEGRQEAFYLKRHTSAASRSDQTAAQPFAADPRRPQ